MRKQTLPILLAFVVVAISVVSCGSKEEAKQAAPRYVKVEQLGTRENTEELVFHGQLKEKKEVNVAFKVGGQVFNVLVDEGDHVKKNQVIARIDPRDYKIQLQSAKAQYIQIEGEYARYKELYKKNKLPVNTLEKMEAGYLAAKSAYEAAQNALNDTELKAPFEGFIYRKKISNFENVAPGQPIFALLDVSHLEVGFSLPESKVNQAKNFTQITVDVANANAYNLPTEVLSINEKANGNDMFDVRLMVNNSESNDLKPGMSAKVRIALSKGNEHKVVLPVESVFEKQGKKYVWVFNQANNKVVSTEVNVNMIENLGLISVTSGLKGDELVVIAGVHSLVENQEVRILDNNKL
ncbi:efflux RND transporter periplasmic adaptor subunit [Carboxylicivirga sp. A043]|uniref:efflux RND transporter periplasmic adaptor subunit n=1 Tax=Carboxylicivirga litoralis TaxID=2816963 RepID=UPI0021CAE732|nr:efflux RND transporter periplasmic adaptor subunit [Carboxylicivirga sp. A043]MCU4157044.1 efflux RND transporter periplasmic adaptor subunit [Carboxylicivirga sp. A043]